MTLRLGSGQVALAPPAPIGVDVTGAALADLVTAEARRRGVSVDRFATDLSRWPAKWLAQLRAARRPTAATVARVRALLAGEPVPRPAANNFQSPRNGSAYHPHAGSWTMKPAAVPAPGPSREPCFRCGTRGDIGCHHQGAAS